jgi:hypothetical protein
VQEGETVSVVREYKRFMAAQWTRTEQSSEASAGGRPAMITDVKLIQRGAPIERTLLAGEPLRIEISIECNMDVKGARLWLNLSAAEKDFSVIGASMYADGHHLDLAKGHNRVILTFETLPLIQGFTYRLYLGIRDIACYTMIADSYASPVLDVAGGEVACLNGIGATRRLSMSAAAVSVPYRWSVEGGAALRNHDVVLARDPARGAAAIQDDAIGGAA